MAGLNRRVNKFVPSPADEAVDQLAVLLQSDAKRRRALEPLQAAELAFESAIDVIRSMTAGSPRAMAEVRDHVVRLRQGEGAQ